MERLTWTGWVGMALSLGVCSINAHASAGGTSGGNVLNIDVGARAVAMGEANTALADDASSIYWNPAGLGLVHQGEATFMHAQWLQDLTYENARTAVPMSWGGLGASLSYLSYGSIDGYNNANTPTGNVRAYSGVATVGGAALLGPLSLGASVKALQGALADVKANAFAADLGATYTYPRQVLSGNLRLATTVRNIGTGLTYLNQTDPLPREWRAGAALLNMVNQRLNVSLDIGKQRDASASVYSGVEYWVHPMIALRAGYAGSDTVGNGLRAGIGLRLKDFSFDYAYGGYGDLGPTHRYEISWRFGHTREKREPAPAIVEIPKPMVDLASVHFDLDRYDLTPAAEKILADNVMTLQRHPDWSILIEGFCDERGSSEYNMELGRKRVAAVREYYLTLGLDPSRMETVSHGKNDPSCPDHNDDCWSRNRSSFTRVRLANHTQPKDGPVVRYHEGLTGQHADDQAEVEQLDNLLKIDEQSLKQAKSSSAQQSSARPGSLQ